MIIFYIMASLQIEYLTFCGQDIIRRSIIICICGPTDQHFVILIGKNVRSSKQIIYFQLNLI